MCRFSVVESYGDLQELTRQRRRGSGIQSTCGARIVIPVFRDLGNQDAVQ